MSKKTIFIIVTLVAIIIYFFSVGSSSFEKEDNMVLESNAPKENTKSLNISSNTKPNTTTVNKESIPQDNTQMVKEEKTLIFKSSTQDKSYILSLYSNKEIKEENRKVVKYLPFKVFLQKDGKKDKLSLSLQDSYKENSDVELSLELFLLKDNTTAICDASFLKNLEFDYLYYLNIDLYDNQISCYIDNKKKLPKLINDDLEIKIEHLSKERQEYLMNEKNKKKD